MKWFGKPKGAKANPQPPPAAPGIYINALGAAMMASLNAMEKSVVDLDLIRARLADFCRDHELQPLEPDEFMRDARSLDVESQKRFALAVAGLDDAATRKAFGRIAQSSAAGAMSLLLEFAREHNLLTIELIIESPLRREELVRHFIARLGSPVAGETESDAKDRLRRLDYRMLLQEAERAKLSAEERLAYLKKLQEQQESKLGRRSKI